MTYEQFKQTNFYKRQVESCHTIWNFNEEQTAKCLKQIYDKFTIDGFWSFMGASSYMNN